MRVWLVSLLNLIIIVLNNVGVGFMILGIKVYLYYIVIFVV